MRPDNLGLEKLAQQKGKRQDNAVRQLNIEKLEMMPSWVKASLAFQPLECYQENAQNLSLLSDLFQTA